MRIATDICSRKKMIKTKYLLYAFKQSMDKNFIYWYETDGKYFSSIKPPKKVLDNNADTREDVSATSCVKNPWLEWDSNDIQKIVSKKGTICINYLKSTNSEFIGKAEDLKLLEMYSFLVKNLDISKPFGFSMVKKWHKEVFQSIYPFAGELRSVNMTKGRGDEVWEWKLQFLSGLSDFDTLLKRVSTQKYTHLDAITLDISKVICDFLFIHPFREGNGRLSRLIGDILLAKNNLPMIGLNLKKSDNYIKKIHDGYHCNYEPMQELLKEKVLGEIKNESVYNAL